MTWQQFLTEKVLKECWHNLEIQDYELCPDVFGICKKCNEVFEIGTENRPYDNRSDLLDLYEAIYRDGKWDDFSGGARWKHTMFSAEDFVEMSAWLFCLSGEGYEERCQMVAEVCNEMDGLKAERDELKKALSSVNTLLNPCGHTGFESNVCEICGYPDPRKMITKLKDERDALEAENKRMREALRYIAFTIPGPTMKTHAEAAQQALKEAVNDRHQQEAV